MRPVTRAISSSSEESAGRSEPVTSSLSVDVFLVNPTTGNQARKGGELEQRSLTVGRSGVKWGAVEEREPLFTQVGRCRMFFGTYTPKLDDKGRLILPAKFRDQLAGGLMVTRGQEHCLYVWPQAEVERITDRLREAPVSNKATRDYVRMFSSASSDETPDKQGRITVPPKLREWANLSKDVVVIGAMNRLEIWDEAAWEAYSESQEESFAELSDEVFPGI
jgi:MraZ protein